MQPFTAGSVYERVRALVNDRDGAVYTNDVILTYLQIAYDDLRNECEDYQIPAVSSTSDVIAITAGVTGIGDSGQPALPKNLVEILDMYERLGGTDDQFLRMDRRQFLPEINVQTTYLQYWSWESDRVKFLGATSNIDVKMHMIVDNFGEINSEGTNIRISTARNFLSFRTAGLCCQFIMENDTRAAELNKNAERTLETFLSTKIKTGQSIVTRRRPFMSGYKQSGGRYFW